MEKITQIQIGLYDQLLNTVGDYIQVVMVSDDLGMQNGLVISPRLYRESIKPFHKELWEFIKRGTRADLFLHSCGSVYKLMPDPIQLGVNILNPIQVAAKDIESERLKKEFVDKLADFNIPFASLRESSKSFSS